MSPSLSTTLRSIPKGFDSTVNRTFGHDVCGLRWAWTYWRSAHGGFNGNGFKVDQAIRQCWDQFHVAMEDLPSENPHISRQRTTTNHIELVWAPHFAKHDTASKRRLWISLGSVAWFFHKGPNITRALCFTSGSAISHGSTKQRKASLAFLFYNLIKTERKV